MRGEERHRADGGEAPAHRNPPARNTRNRKHTKPARNTFRFDDATVTPRCDLFGAVQQSIIVTCEDRCE